MLSFILNTVVPFGAFTAGMSAGVYGGVKAGNYLRDQYEKLTFRNKKLQPKNKRTKAKAKRK